MTTLVDQIIAELTAEWTAANTSTKTPVFINLKDQDREFSGRGNASGEGEVVGISTGDAVEEVATITRGSYIITTPFTITADSDTESIRDQYLVEIKRIIRAKSITSGHWEITRNFPDDNIRDSSGILSGEEVRFE